MILQHVPGRNDIFWAKTSDRWLSHGFMTLLTLCMH